MENGDFPLLVYRSVTTTQAQAIMELYSPPPKKKCSKVWFSVFFRAMLESSPLCLLHPIRISDLFWKTLHFPATLLCTQKKKHPRGKCSWSSSGATSCLRELSHDRIPIKKLLVKQQRTHAFAQYSLFSMVGQFLDMSYVQSSSNFINIVKIMKGTPN